jgi:SAM-dependent methyltransferase
LSALQARVLELMKADARERAHTAEGGYLDLLEADLQSTGRSQDLMLTSLVPAIYERWWRPALGRAFKGITGPGMDEEIRIARLLLGLQTGHRVLDVACGPANFTRAFARAISAEGLAVGVDASETMLTRGVRDTERAGLDNVALLRADATDLPFEAGCFDAVCCFAALHLFAEPHDAIAEMTRVLAPGGRVAIMTSVRRPVTLPPLKPVLERASGMRVFEREEIVSALQLNDYDEIHQRVSGLVQFVGARLAA